MKQTYREKILAHMSKTADDLGTQATQQINMGDQAQPVNQQNSNPTEIVNGLKEHLRAVLAAERQLQTALTGILQLGETAVTEIRPDLVTPYENVYKNVKAFNMQIQKTVVTTMALIKQLESQG